MWSIFRRKHDREREEETQLQVDELKKALFEDIERSTNQARKVNNIIDRYAERDDITLNIFLATGGDRRK